MQLYRERGEEGGGLQLQDTPGCEKTQKNGGGGGLQSAFGIRIQLRQCVQLVCQMPRTGLVPPPLLDSNSVHLHIKK